VDINGSLSTIASGHQDGSLRFWDINTGNPIHQIPKHHNAHVTSVEYSPNSSFYIASYSRDNSVNIVDTRKYETMQVVLPNYSSTETHDLNGIRR
jgi:WD40 repeat protein